jgi:hypothetical protein
MVVFNETLYIMRIFNLFILFFLCLLAPAIAQNYTCPESNIAGSSPCVIVNGCIYRDYGLILAICGDNSHYYMINYDGGAFSQRTFSYLTLPIDDYILLFGLIPVIYAVYYLRRKAV